MKIGDLFAEQGNQGEAAKSYQAGLDIAQALAARDPANDVWQRSLIAFDDKIGACRRGARRSFGSA